MNYEEGKEAKVLGEKVIPIHGFFCTTNSGLQCVFHSRPCNDANCSNENVLFLSKTDYIKYLTQRLTE